MRWSTIENGELLALATKEFDVFVTVDRNLSFQQHSPRSHRSHRVAAVSNRLADLNPWFRTAGVHSRADECCHYVGVQL